MLRIYNPPKSADVKSGEFTLQPKKLTAEEEKKIADMFKATDKDGDMKVGKQELVDKVIEEYKNTGKLPDGYDNLGDYIADQMKNFGKYDKNKDGKLNIDEYTEMSTAPKIDEGYVVTDEDILTWIKEHLLPRTPDGSIKLPNNKPARLNPDIYPIVKLPKGKEPVVTYPIARPGEKPLNIYTIERFGEESEIIYDKYDYTLK